MTFSPAQPSPAEIPPNPTLQNATVAACQPKLTEHVGESGLGIRSDYVGHVRPRTPEEVDHYSAQGALEQYERERGIK